MPDSLTVAPTSDPRRVRAPDGTLLTPPAGWALLPPGDAGLTRRVKAAGPTWTVVEKKGRKTFSRGVWAPEAHITAARAELEVERATPAYAKRRASDQARREREQAEYEVDFANAVLRFLAFAPTFTAHAKRLAVVVTAHAAPVGSGTVARTERIPVERRAEAAVIAWLRHQTTRYDDLRIARVKGARREVRRELAEVSRALLDAHRRDTPHTPTPCPLCSALENLPKPG
ncbi:MAG: DUF2293 domain-containing protein [Hyalangium sp.]|uniref:DUF2293 domain-containing protein n=1 Tax=Hyalangium sp. TaxID=2028555 RepID=UPI00389B3A04